MKYILPVSIESSKRNAGVIWDFLNAKRVRNTIISIITGCILPLLSLSKGLYRPVDYAIFSAGCVLILIFVPAYYQLRKQKTAYIKRSIEGNRFSDGLEISFSDDSLTYSTSLIHSKVNWKMITSYILINDVIALQFYNSVLLTFNKKDLPENEFNSIVTFIKAKIPLGDKAKISWAEDLYHR